MTPAHILEARSSGPPTDLLALAWLAGYSSHKTRRTYQTMIRSWFDRCGLCGLEPLAVRRAHVELWQRALEQRGYAERTIALKLSAVASFYRYCEREDLLARTPDGRRASTSRRTDLSARGTHPWPGA
jgi:integrase/recombinase XerD